MDVPDSLRAMGFDFTTGDKVCVELNTAMDIVLIQQADPTTDEYQNYETLKGILRTVGPWGLTVDNEYEGWVFTPWSAVRKVTGG